MKPRYVSKDKNHNTLRDVFLRLGCSVAETVDTGIPGFPDTVVGCMGVNHLVECKNLETQYGRAGLNSNQTAFARDWRGEKVWTVETEDGVIALVNQWRRPIRFAPSIPQTFRFSAVSDPTNFGEGGDL